MKYIHAVTVTDAALSDLTPWDVPVGAYFVALETTGTIAKGDVFGRLYEDGRGGLAFFKVSNPRQVWRPYDGTSHQWRCRVLPEGATITILVQTVGEEQP